MAALRLAPARLRQALLWSIPPQIALSRSWSSMAKASRSLFDPLNTFTKRHIGPHEGEAAFMLSQLGYESMEDFLSATVPPKIRIADTNVSDKSIPALSELELRARAKRSATKTCSLRATLEWVIITL